MRAGRRRDARLITLGLFLTVIVAALDLSANMSEDPTSQANYLKIVSQHIDFVWTIDFTKKIVSGSATHTLKVLQGDIDEVMYDLLLVITSIRYH